MAKDNKSIEEINGVPAERQGTRPDFSTPPPRKRLPKEIQDTLNDEEKLWEVLYDGEYVTSSQLSVQKPALRPNTFRITTRSTTDKMTEAKTQQTPPSATPPTPLVSAQSCSQPTAT
jgi:hypothetical protein